MEWRQCFLCLADLGRRNPLRILKVFNYLISSESRKKLKSLNLSSTTEADSEQLLPEACESCSEYLDSIQKLHSELEVVQMKLIDRIKTLQTRIISNSKEYGNNDNSTDKLSLFEEWLEEQNSNGFTHEPERKLLDDLFCFQTAVYNRAKESVQVPLIYLKAHSGQAGMSIPPFSGEDLVHGENTDMAVVEDVVKFEMKTENSFQPIQGNDQLEQLPSSPEVPDITLDKPKRKRGRPPSKKRLPPPTKPILTSQLISNDDTKDEDYAPKPKRCRPSSKKLVPKATRLSSQRSAADVAKASIFLSSSTIKTDKKPQKTYKYTGDYIPRSRIIPSFAKSVKVKQGSEKRYIFNCALCPYTNLSHFRFEAHVREHEASIPEKTFACTKCPEMFSTHLGLDLHAAFHTNFFKFKCEGCKEQIPPLELPSHLATHSEKTIPCPNCSYYSISRENYLSHLMLHPAKTGNNIKFICDICSNNFPSTGSLVLHLNSAHRAVEKFTCTYEGCGKSYSLPGTLKNHMTLHTKPEICKQCGKAFSTLQRLKIHLKTHMDKSQRVPEIPCKKCSSKFFYVSQLKTHMINVHGSSKFKCEPCGLEYVTKESLESHNNLVHLGIKWNCTVEGCGVEFGCRLRLRQHMRRRHQDRAPDVCEECGAQFRSANGLTKHRAIHENKKEHVCPQCGKGFNSKEYLRGHMLLHNDEKKYVCEICGQGFKQKAALYLHRKRHKLPEDSNNLQKELE